MENNKINKKIKIIEDGPYQVLGNVPLAKESVVPDEDDNPLEWEKGEEYKTEKEYFLCRCGKSGNKPFCDKSHLKEKFDGKETASKESYENQAETIPGVELDLRDAQVFCTGAGFCHRKGGTWRLAQESDNPESKKLAIEQACNCPSGRLTAIDKKTGKSIEPKFFPSISVMGNVGKKADGPLRVKGGISIESCDGSVYEARNRQTICRCGKSKNKPFCDGSHSNA